MTGRNDLGPKFRKPKAALEADGISNCRISQPPLVASIEECSKDTSDIPIRCWAPLSLKERHGKELSRGGERCGWHMKSPGTTHVSPSPCNMETLAKQSLRNLNHLARHVSARSFTSFLRLQTSGRRHLSAIRTSLRQQLEALGICSNIWLELSVAVWGSQCALLQHDG